MSKVIANMSMSLDGFVSHPESGVAELFGWYADGDVAIPTDNANVSLQVLPESAETLRARLGGIGALIAGRRTFDDAGGWGGHHPTGVPTYVVTHNPPADPTYARPAITFVTDGIKSTLAQALDAANGKAVAIASADLTRQYLDAGLVDEIVVDLVPVLLGDGVRFFDHLKHTPIHLSAPEVVQSTSVTHLLYHVIKE